MRQVPAPLAGINLKQGLLSHRAELVKILEAEAGRLELRAVTGPDYGPIWDDELVAAVMRIAGDGTGDTRWKVPGLLDWSTMTHNPFGEVTTDTGLGCATGIQTFTSGAWHCQSDLAGAAGG